MCHSGLLWEGDAYPLAAAQQLLRGKALYRDIWFDKPPLLALAYLSFGALPGWPLRLFGACNALLACWVAYAFGRDQWGEREGRWAAALLAWSLCFDFPAAVIPVASDLLMLAPHLAALWLAAKRPFWSGVLAAAAFWINPKGALIFGVCVIWNPAGLLPMGAGFAALTAAVLAWLTAGGAFASYWEEVWRWGRLYAAHPFEEAPLHNGVLRTFGWAGFHSAILIAAACGRREAGPRQPPRARWLGWLLLSLVGVAAGLRFFPRYYFLLLPVVVMLSARGFSLLQGWRRMLVGLLLLIPLLRFAPTYVAAASNATWRDTAMDRDSRAAAALVLGMARAGDTLFVWGYRPEDYVYTRLPAATLYLDSQPLSGIPADRHLTQTVPVETGAPRQRRVALADSKPSFILDGLGPYNPPLALRAYPDLRAWLSQYQEVARTAGTVIYRRKAGPMAQISKPPADLHPACERALAAAPDAPQMPSGAYRALQR